MNKKAVTVVAILLSCIICFNLAAVENVQAGVFADLFGIQDDTGGFLTDNTFDYGLGKLSDSGQEARKNFLKQAMEKFRLSEKLRKTGKFTKSSRYFRDKCTNLVNQGSRIGKAVKFLGGAMMVLNVVNTSSDTYKLFTENSKHDTTTEKAIDKTLGAIDAGMGWYAVCLGIGAIIAAPTIGAGVVAAGAVTGGTYLVTKLTVGVSRIAFNSQTYRNFSAFVRGKKKLVFAPFTRPGMKEGLDIIEEELGFDLYPGLKREIPDPSTGIPVYKPNIYIYNEEDIDINVKIYPSNWITKSIPEYDIINGWDASIIDGSINGSNDFLFYEALVPDEDFQKDEGFMVNSDSMISDMEYIMEQYGYTFKETKDFIEYWVQVLDSNKDYVFYPQTTEIVDFIMPLVTDKNSESYFRLWFYISEKDENQILKKPDIQRIERNGLTIVEWGGVQKDRH